MSTPKHNIPADKLDLYEKLITTNSKIKRKGVAKAYTPLNGHMFSYLDPSGSLALRLRGHQRQLASSLHNRMWKRTPPWDRAERNHGVAEALRLKRTGSKNPQFA